MAQLDLSTVAPEKRGRAVMDHLAHVMAGTAQDPRVRVEIATAILAHRALDR